MAKKRNSEPTPELLNISQISRRFGISRNRARGLLQGTQPAKTQGQTAYYSVSDVLRAVKSGSDGGDEKRQVEIRRITAQAEKLELELQVERGKYVEEAKVAEALHRTIAAQRSILTQKLEREFPTECTGLQPEQIRVLGKRLNDDIVAKMRELGEYWDI